MTLACIWRHQVVLLLFLVLFFGGGVISIKLTERHILYVKYFLVKKAIAYYNNLHIQFGFATTFFLFNQCQSCLLGSLSEYRLQNLEGPSQDTFQASTARYSDLSAPQTSHYVFFSFCLCKNLFLAKKHHLSHAYEHLIRGHPQNL